MLQESYDIPLTMMKLKFIFKIIFQGTCMIGYDYNSVVSKENTNENVIIHAIMNTILVRNST